MQFFSQWTYTEFSALWNLFSADYFGIFDPSTGIPFSALCRRTGFPVADLTEQKEDRYVLKAIEWWSCTEWCRNVRMRGSSARNDDERTGPLNNHRLHRLMWQLSWQPARQNSHPAQTLLSLLRQKRELLITIDAMAVAWLLGEMEIFKDIKDSKR